MAKIYVEGEPYEVKDGQNLLQACLSLGFNLPYFCWHPAMGSVGACRQCAVKQFKDENDAKGRIVMACMTAAKDGTRISIDDPEIRHFRATVIAWLMTNHPHDCPVCDEGGECHLQDMTVLTGHDYREFRFDKRTHRNQYLGPFVNHEMNRCIACYRCVRFYCDYADGRDFGVFGAHNYVYFGRHAEGVLQSEFSGNLVEICPTGVFTDKTLKRHYTRKWDLQTAPSICVHCGLGCNTIPGERYGTLRRIRNRYNHEVNGYFLCDRGRYGYEFVNHETRVRQSLVRESTYDKPDPIARVEVLRRLAEVLKEEQQVIGIGSPRASLEANFALRTFVGPEHFYLGLSETERQLIALILEIFQNGPARSPSQREVGQADAILLLGEDVTDTAPMLALALRQAVRRQPMAMIEDLDLPAWDDKAVREALQDRRGPLYIATPYTTRLDDVATGTYRAAPGDLARLGQAVTQHLDGNARAVDDLPGDVAVLAQEIAGALGAAQRPLVIAGTGSGSAAVIRAAANVAWALCCGDRQANLCFTVPECNTLGLGLMGGHSLEEAFHAVQSGKADTVIVLENDLYRRADAQQVRNAIEIARHSIVLDHLLHQTAAQAEYVLPAATFAETSGTFVNSEGRAQRFYRVFEPEADVCESWRWLRDLMVAAGRPEAREWHSLDDVLAAMVEALPVFEPALHAAPPAGFRIVRQKVPRQSHRYTGRTAMHVHGEPDGGDLDMVEPKPPADPDSPLAFSMEGYEGQPPPALIPRYWAPHWNSVQALNRFQEEIAGPLRGGDPGKRLIEPDGSSRPDYHAPEGKDRGTGGWLTVSLHHIFGSEELSALSPGVMDLSPEPYVALSPEDAARLGLEAGQEIEFTVDDRMYRLPLKLLPGLASGLAGLPAGLRQIPYLVPPGKRAQISGESSRE